MMKESIDEIWSPGRMTMPIEVLDNGFVRLVNTLGGDHSVVSSARVSYGNETKGEKADKGLINFLMKHDHGTPFEHIVFTFHIKCPIFVARQWFRHRIASYNEISGRYVEMKDEFYYPAAFRANNKLDKQSSGDYEWETNEFLDMCDIYDNAIRDSYQAYKNLIDYGLCREQARGILPMAIYTEFYWTVNARSLFNFIKLRAAPNAQWEIQEYANIINKIVSTIAPWTFEAFNKYVLDKKEK